MAVHSKSTQSKFKHWQFLSLRLCPTSATFRVLQQAIHLSFVRLTFDGLMNLNVNANRSNIGYKGKRQL